jgi:hypothetical protein
MILILILILLGALFTYGWIKDAQHQVRDLREALTREVSQIQCTCEAWKSHAIALEAFCEALGERDERGCDNASAEILRTRQTLVSMGEYDA